MGTLLTNDRAALRAVTAVITDATLSTAHESLTTEGVNRFLQHWRSIHDALLCRRRMLTFCQPQ